MAEYTSPDEQSLIEGLKAHASKGAIPDFPFDDLRFTLDHAVKTITQMAKEREAERDEVQKLSSALRRKDAAMGELFSRLREAGVDYQDLLS